MSAETENRVVASHHHKCLQRQTATLLVQLRLNNVNIVVDRSFLTWLLQSDRPKFGFGFGYGAETGDIFSFGYGRNREARFRPTFGYGRNYDKVSAVPVSSTAAVLLMSALSRSER